MRRRHPPVRPYWAGDAAYRSDDGSFTECGVYLTLADFLQAHWRAVTESEWQALAALAVDHDERAEAPSSTVGACLIEGLDSECFSALVVKFFDPRLLRRYGFRQ